MGWEFVVVGVAVDSGGDCVREGSCPGIVGTAGAVVVMGCVPGQLISLGLSTGLVEGASGR